MATDIRFARLVASLVADTREYSAGLKDSISVSTSWVEKLKTVVVDKGLSLLIDAAKKAGQALIDLGRRFIGLVIDAAPLEGIGLAFDKMSERVGLSLDALRQAAAGTVSDFELMKSANIALTGAGEMLGQELGQSLPRLLEIARAAARATGQDVGFLFQSLVSGVKRSSPMLIDNTGLVLKLGEANQALADELGIAVSELSAEEKQIALLRATAQAGQAMIDEFGGGQQTAAEAIGVFRAQIQNATDQIGLAFLPVLQAILGPLGEVGGDLGGKVVAWAQKLAAFITPLAERFGDLIKAIADGEDPLGAIQQALSDIGLGQIAQAVQVLRNIWNEVWPDIQARVEEVLPIVIELADKIATWFEETGPVALESFKEVWAEVWGFAMSQVDTVVAWFQENLPLIEETGIKLAEFWETRIVPALDNAWEIIKTIVSTAVSIVSGIITTVMQVITGDWEGAWATIKETVAGIWEGIKTIVTEFIEGVLNAVGTNIEEFQATWRNNWEMLKTIITTIWTNIVTAVTGFIENIIESVTGRIEAFRETWRNNWEMAQEIVAGIWERITTTISEFIAGIFEAIGVSQEEFVETWRNNWQGIQDIVAEIWGRITETISSAIAGVVGFVVSKVTGFIEAWRVAWEGIREAVSVVWQSIVMAVSTAIENTLAPVRTGIEEFVETWRQRWDNVKETVATTWEGIKTAVQQTAATIIGNVITWITNMINVVKGKASEFIQAGVNLMRGLRDGILKTIGEVVSAITEAAENAIAVAKAILGISSPSLVFNVIGRQIDEGLAGGIMGNAAAPRMAMAAVAAGVTRTATSNASYYFNQTIHTTDSGLAATQGFESMRSRFRDR